jgi:hypothetical protein
MSLRAVESGSAALNWRYLIIYLELEEEEKN